MIIPIATQVLAKYVLLPLIEVATDPDYLNRWILKALKKAEKDSSERKQTGSNSDSPDRKPRKQQLMKMDSFETGTSYQVITLLLTECSIETSLYF